MRALQDLRLFVRAAHAASLSAAARSLDMSPAVASASIKRLEAELHTRLFVRSTRSLRLTSEGSTFLSHCEQALELLERASEDVSLGSQHVRGPLQLSVPSDLGRQLILPWLMSFRERFPQITIRIQVSDRVAGIRREQVDIGLRYGDPPDSSFVALPVLPANRRVLCASPAYIARAGAPTTPEELAQHNCICWFLGHSAHDRWRFTKGTREVEVSVRGSFVCDDGDAVRRLVVLGQGIAYKSWLDVADDVRAGRLVRLCADWQTERAPLHLVCSDRRQLTPAVRQLRAFLEERCAEHVAASESA